ncbi:division/cell wall cluster transcriptional repressor MraZ [Litorimonas sp.]|jgi:MraZ protein|uniref:division/cell wall cluster transcriptional repressor MraZ n=1 Tax=Litorimonas sp. TaxID=1892381 RepID=UPI003A86D40B
MFLSSVTNKVDAKGRVSVPADFRAVVAGSGFDGIVVWPSFDGQYLEGGGMALMEEYQRSLDTLDYYDEGRIALQRAIFAASRPLQFDTGGRISLPKDLHDYAGLNGHVTFVGLGRRFEIWSPIAHEERAGQMRKLAKENRHRLRPVPAPLPGGGPS